MCSGAKQREQNARREQERQNQIAAQRQAELNRLAAEREATAAAQQAQLQVVQQQMAAQTVAQQAKADQLGAQQQERLGGIRAAGTAVTQSLRILGQAGGQQAPTAAVAPRQKAQAGARSTTASLRMGATGQGTGSGANVAV